MLFILVTTPLSISADPATIISDTALYQYPSFDAPTLAPLNSGQQVDSLGRSGSWNQISTENSQTGWVRSYQLRSGIVEISSQKETSGGFFSGLAHLSRKASGLFTSKNKGYSFQRTATIGVRGLSEEEIKNAKADLKELKKMESYRSNKNSAKRFANSGNLVAIKVVHMPPTNNE